MERSEERRTSISDEVHDFYERMPYPPPLTNLDDHLNHYLDPSRRRAHFHLLFPTEKPRPNREILIAGCGTSQAAKYALREPDAQITAIDVSETSLRHTNELQRKYDLKNLELHQLPIERVGELRRSFDQVVCTGVLHHLPDPDAGLHVLRNVLKPQGAMMVMVYARFGRAGIYMMQEYCRLLGVSDSAKELEDLGKMLAVLTPDHPMYAVLRHAKDFAKPAAMADALLHPQDRAYTVPEIYDWLDRCGMSFGRWHEQAPYLAQCGLVAKSAHFQRLAALTERSQHAAVELLRGTMVAHQFIAYRDDKVGKGQPIDFDGNRWTNYIPIRLPWTVTVRDRLPADKAAVLINRSHTFTDLLCMVDPFEDTILGVIDGKRSVGEILRTVSGGTETSAKNFIERLWQYDQIVIDAAEAG